MSVDSIEENVGEYIPFLFSWEFKESDRMFENGISPDPGDEIKIICYESGSKDGRNFAKCVFRVVKDFPELRV